MKIKQKVSEQCDFVRSVYRERGNGNMGVGVGISFGKNTAFVDKKSGLVHFVSCRL